MITQTLQLNLVPKGISPRLYVTQYDYGSRTLTFEIYNSSNRFTLTSGTTTKIQGTKPDRHGFSYDATVDTTNNVITADLTQQMTAVDGEVVVEIVLIKSNKRIGTLNFVMVVQPAGLNDDTDTSDTDLPDIIAEATEQMLTAEAYAKGTRNGTAVTSGQTGYHDNSKYYKEQAATQANNASNSATSANTNALKAEGYAVGKQNGTTQTSGTYYHNNAQYYKEQAASSATTASTKAGEASTSANTASQKASAASTSAQTASDKALVAEGYAKGTQNGTPVGSTSPYYHNNAEYFKNLANPTVAANVSFNNSGTEMSSTNVQDGIVENRTSIQNLSTVVSKNGAKNLLPFDLATVKIINQDGTWSGNTYTHNGLTFTVLQDSNGYLTGITVSGTASDTTFLNLAEKDFGNTDLDFTNPTANGFTISGGFNSGRMVKYQQSTKKTYIRIGNGSSIATAITFKPMIRLASDTDGTYEPYAKTNVELTADDVGVLDNINKRGAKNYVSLNRSPALPQYKSGVTIVEQTENKLQISCSNASWASISLNYKLAKGDYKLRYNVTSLDNFAPVVIVYGIQNGNSTEIKNTRTGKLDFTIAQDYDYIQFRFHASEGAATRTVTYSDFLVADASMTDETYEPYAMGNGELTQKVKYISQDWQSITGITGAADETAVFTNLIGATTLLIDCVYKNESGGYYILTNLVHANVASDLLTLKAVNVATLAESYRTITWDSATGTLTVKRIGKNRASDGTISEDKLFCYPTRIKAIF